MNMISILDNQSSLFNDTFKNVSGAVRDKIAVVSNFLTHIKINKDRKIFFIYLVTKVDTVDGPVLKGLRVENDVNYNLDDALKIFNQIIYKTKDVKVYLIQSVESCNNSFETTSRYDKNLDTCLPKESNEFKVVAYSTVSKKK